MQPIKRVIAAATTVDNFAMRLGAAVAGKPVMLTASGPPAASCECPDLL